MRKLFVLLTVCILSGCSTVHVKTPDCEATYTRVWYETEGFDAKVCGGRATVSKTTQDVSETLGAILPMLLKAGAGVP